MSAIADHATSPLDLPALRRRLSGKAAPAFWRSLEELAGTSDFQAFLDSEFPRIADYARTAPNRRSVLKALGAALAVGGLAACRKADEIVPYVDRPEDIVPGRPLHYATSLSIDGFAFGAIVESHEGRPTKIEGNPDHPATLGASDAIMQAACFSLYDPDRSRYPQRAGEPASWEAFLGEIAGLRAELHARRGAGLALVLGTSTSPTLADQIGKLRAQFPEMRIFRHEPLRTTGESDALAARGGANLRSLHHLKRADVILSLDFDFLGEGPARLADARAFSSRRIVRDGANSMSRLYSIESTPTITGASADHRWAARASAIASIAAELAASLGVSQSRQNGANGTLPPAALDTIASDLKAAGSRALVVAGLHQPPTVHALTHAINAALGSLGTTVDYVPDPALRFAGEETLADLVSAIDAGSIDALVIFDGDPAYSAPGDVPFAAALPKVPLSIHHGLHVDRTSSFCRWHIPATHDLESWSDLAAFDGTRSIVQPLIQPLYAGRTIHEVLAALAGDYQANPREIVRNAWRERAGFDDAAWQSALQKGVAQKAPAPAAAPTIGTGWSESAGATPDEPRGIEIRFVPDAWLRAGEYSPNAWLQELPRPLTKIVWGNAAMIAPATAEQLGLGTGDVITIGHEALTITIPISIEPGHPEHAVTLPLGFGRRTSNDDGHGSDVYPLRSSAGPWILTGATITRTQDRGRIVTTQHHHAMEGRDIVRHATLAEYLAMPDSLHGEPPAADESLYPPWTYKDEAWGMVIDQTACIGCMACVSACQAENNIPSVGIDECERGHEMQWLRVDRYYSGAVDAPETFFQPVPCMQCEKAPCEVVCPVNATVHTHDGLNAQVYNRCIGTRYCSQNCPYKVRRFNFLEYQPFEQGKASPLAPLMNPDVSVRSRGVMEKCTYCVQRISKARIDADIDGRPISDGEIVTACQQACPTRAIVFGDLNKPDSEVRRLRKHPLDYTLLAELNTRPRTTYLGRIRNPHPALAPPETEGGDG